MSIYLVSGKLGSGKTLLSVSRIRKYLQEGRRVATNLDLKIEKMLPSKAGRPRRSDGVAKWYQPLTVTRVPDKPTAEDLEALGKGCNEVDESKYGLLVLDELGSWLNSRDWNAKGRIELIDWLIHSRKRRWDVIFIIQDAAMLDKQIRESLVEYSVQCKRLDKVRVPVVGLAGRFLTLGAWNGCVGRLHLGIVRYTGGALLAANALIIERWLYRGTDLFQSYDTEQVFSASYASGSYDYLTPWHLVGRYERLKGWALRWHRLKVMLGVESPVPRKIMPAAKLKPLMRLPPDLRWSCARSLVAKGYL